MASRAAQERAVVKNAPTLDITALCQDSRIQSLDAKLCRLVKQLPEKTVVCEANIAKLELNRLVIDDPNFNEDVCSRHSVGFDDLAKRPDAQICLQQVWNRSFSGRTFVEDVEALASKLLGQPTKIRTVNVGAQNPSTGEIRAHYPSPNQIEAGLPILESLIEQPCCRLPFLSAFIAMVYYYRLHPMVDGNGRTSRAIVNICLRNYSLINRPILLISPVLFCYLPLVEPVIRSGKGDMLLLFARLLRIAQKSLEVATENQQLPG